MSPELGLGKSSHWDLSVGGLRILLLILLMQHPSADTQNQARGASWLGRLDSDFRKELEVLSPRSCGQHMWGADTWQTALMAALPSAASRRCPLLTCGVPFTLRLPFEGGAVQMGTLGFVGCGRSSQALITQIVAGGFAGALPSAQSGRGQGPHSQQSCLGRTLTSLGTRSSSLCHWRHHITATSYCMPSPTGVSISHDCRFFLVPGVVTTTSPIMQSLVAHSMGVVTEGDVAPLCGWR